MRIIALVITLSGAQLQGAPIFNVNYGSSGIPSISGPGGTLPPPPGLPSASLLLAGSPNSTHISGGGEVLWIDRYDSGDYFGFSIIGADPSDRIALSGLWFGILAGDSAGPATFEVEMISEGGGSQEVFEGAPGVYAFDTPGVISETSAIELRFTGIGGVDDVFGINESFGIQFVSATFEVVPEPSALLLSVAGGLLFLTRRRRSAPFS